MRAPSRRSGVCVIEGWRLLEAAIAAGVHLDSLVLTEEAAADHAAAAVRDAARVQAGRELVVTTEVFAVLTQVPAPQGVLGIAPRPRDVSPVPPRDPQTLAVVLDAVQDPGNVGTIIRTAVACGATIVIACAPSADPFGAKALRASAGAAFRVRIADAGSAGEAAAALRSAGVRLIVADAHAPTPAAGIDWSRPLALVLGGEAAGPALVWRDYGATAVRVPVPGPVESLNVAAAAAVLLYQAAGILGPR